MKRRLYIFPCVATDNRANCGLIYAKLLCEFSIKHTPSSMATPNYPDIIACKSVAPKDVLTHPIFGNRAPNVRPSSPCHNGVNSNRLHVEHIRQLRLGDTAASVQLSNFQDSRIIKFCIALSLASCITAAPLLNHILGVIFRCPQEHVGRIDTARIVTIGAIVANKQTIWNRPISQLPCNTGGGRHLSAILEFSVTLRKHGVPYPTPVRAILIYFGPKTLLDSSLAAFLVMLWKVARLLAGFFRYPDGLTTTTLTQRSNMKFIFSGARGIITHVNSPFTTLTTPPNGSRRCGGNFIGVLLDYFSTFGRVLQSAGGAA